MAVDFSDINSARVAFRQLYNQVQSIFNWDFKGSRLQNIGKGTADSDGVNVSQLNAAIKTVTPTASNSGDQIAQTIDNLKISTSFTPTLDNIVDIGSTGLRFKKLWVYLIDVATNIKFSGLTASLPLKLDASKLTISAAIDLSTAEVTNKLTLAKGGTNVDLSGTGGTSQVLKQNAGHVISVAQLAASDLSDAARTTFTPVLAFGGLSTGITFSSNTGTSYQLGKLVFINISFTLTSKGSSTGVATIKGHTKNAAAGVNGALSLIFTLTFGDGSTAPIIVQVNGDTINLFYVNLAAGASHQLSDTDFTDTTTLILAGTYLID